MYKGKNCIGRSKTSWSKKQLMEECDKLHLDYSQRMTKAELCKILNTAKTNDNLFRLLLNDDQTIIIRAPSREQLESFIDQPGDVGYHLTEILMLLYKGSDTLREATIIELGKIKDDDSILDWSLIQNDETDNI